MYDDLLAPKVCLNSKFESKDISIDAGITPIKNLKNMAPPQVPPHRHNLEKNLVVEKMYII